jgi:signal peptidase II
MNKKNVRYALLHWGAFFLASGLLIAVDQWLKQWSTANLSGEPSRVLISGVLGLTYWHNTGAAFGLLSGFGWGLRVISVLVVFLLAGVAWFYYRLPKGKWYWFLRVPMILIFAGGLGNLIDRIRLGYVVDMLEFLFMNFAIFNLADVFVTTGVFVLFPILLFMGKNAPWPFGEPEAKPNDTEQ